MRDMTRGAPLGHLFLYAVPLLLGNWLQLAYNAVDAIIVGRFLGQGALAAEGVAGPVMNLVILAISGLCIGAGVLMSEACGARDAETLRAVLATTLLAGAALCAAVALLGVACAPWVLRALAVPGGIYAPALAYLRVTFLGAPFTFFYNALAAALKSIGDSKTPLKFLAFSAVLNAALDLICIGALGFGIVCSAVTTVAAEAASALLAAVYLARRAPGLCPARRDWRIRPALLGRIARYGAVTALQQAVQPICKVLIQGQVNALGVGAMRRSTPPPASTTSPSRPSKASPPPSPPTSRKTAARASRSASGPVLPPACGWNLPTGWQSRSSPGSGAGRWSRCSSAAPARRRSSRWAAGTWGAWRCSMCCPRSPTGSRVFTAAWAKWPPRCWAPACRRGCGRWGPPCWPRGWACRALPGPAPLAGA